MVCVDEVNDSVQQIASDLQSRYTDLKEDIETSQEKQDELRKNPKITAYRCNLLNHNGIHDIAKKVKNEIGGIDILVTCVGAAGQDIFDTASTTLMSHYWVSIISKFIFYFFNDFLHDIKYIYDLKKDYVIATVIPFVRINVRFL